MAVTGDQVAALRASLTLDQAQARDWRDWLIRSRGLDGFGELMYAAFVLAVRRRFAPAWTRADVVRYVGSVRAHGLAEGDIEPLAAESLILRALGRDVPPGIDEQAKAAAQAVLLAALVADLGLDDAALDQFLDQAWGLADRWLSGPA